MQRLILPVERAVQAALHLLREGRFNLPEREAGWLDILEEQAESLPEDEETLTARVLPSVDRTKIHLDQYGITA